MSKTFVLIHGTWHAELAREGGPFSFDAYFPARISCAFAFAHPFTC